MKCYVHFILVMLAIGLGSVYVGWVKAEPVATHEDAAHDDAMPDGPQHREPTWGKVAGGLQSRIVLDDTPAAADRVRDPASCRHSVRFLLRNVGKEEVVVWRRGFWTNHRIDVTGPNGKPATSTPLGLDKRREFLAAGPREKNAPQPLPPGAIDEAYDPICLEEHFELKQPGEYRVRVLYQEAVASPRVVSNRLVVVVSE